MSKAPPEVLKVKKSPTPAIRNEREARKELYNIERTIARLDEQKKLSNTQLMSAADPKDAMQLHTEVLELTKQLNLAEEQLVRAARGTGRETALRLVGTPRVISEGIIVGWAPPTVAC